MLVYRGTAAGAALMAFVSAAGLGAGIVGLVPVLNNILGHRQTLPELAEQINERLAAASLDVRIPASWIASLPDSQFDAVLWIVLGLGVLTILGAAANFLHEFLSLTLATRTIGDIRRAAFHRVLHFPLGVIVQGSGADMVSRILHDTQVLNRGFQMVTSKAVAQSTKGLAAFIAALVINWKLALITSASAPLLYLVIRKLGKRIRRASRASMQSQAKLMQAANEALSSFRVVKAMGAERFEIARFSKLSRDKIREQLKLRTAKALAGPLIEVISIFVLGGLALVAAKAILDGALTSTEFIAALGSLGIAGASLKPLTSVLQDIQIADAAAGRLETIMSAELEDMREHSRDRRPRLPRHARSIEFRGVTLRFPSSERAAVRDVSVFIEHGQTVAVVGPNGSGKTSLLSLLPRLYVPEAGLVLIDGVDISQVSLRSLRAQIGVVPQEPVLFRGTIAENIAYGRTAADRPSREQIQEAARRAHAHEFIMQQPHGYETVVGEQGLTLSGGQRQRLAIARAILRDPAILILDEATSMIDAESEAQIAAAISEFSRRRTCFIVAHRLSTVRNADRILVLDRGRLIDDGRHEELIERCPIYASLTAAQMVGAGA